MIAKELENADWENDCDNPDNDIRTVWLGSCIALCPSQKFYMPFACSNVAGDCPVCKGEGSISPRTGKRVRARAKRRGHDFSKGTVKRGCMGVPAAQRYAARVQSFRDRAYRAYNLTCVACDGMGSISAARDERWREKLERDAEAIDAFIDYRDGDIFVSQVMDAQEREEECEEV
jgi:hypothetical protein